MINKDNVGHIIDYNKQYLPKIKADLDFLKSSGDPLIASKPLEYMKTYLFEHAHVIEFPVKNKDYGGLIFYHNQHFYIQINTAQPKVYENFMWAHEFYHFYFDREKIRKKEENFIVIDSVFDEKERLPNLFASESLINSFVLERKYHSLKKAYKNDHLAEIVMNLIPVFELPYKAIAVKLAQDGLIEVDEARDIIDFDYQKRLPYDMDRTLFSASLKIKIDHYSQLIKQASSTMNEADHQSIVEKHDALYKRVLNWREELGGGSKDEGD